jgi:pimeloyl-ACP methyl ester carboxylesterase
MKRAVVVLLLASCASLILPRTMHGQTITRPHDFVAMRNFRDKPHLPISLSRPQQTPRPPASASPEIDWVQCPAEAEILGAICGYVPVPLDRQHPDQAKIRIYFELYVHSNPGPAESAILANPGGPGYTTTGQRELGLLLFGQNLNVHDILGIDDRGRGFSGTIDCQKLQHGTAPFGDAEADCAAQLGNSASFYGTGDIAMDTDAVRAALGYDKVDYFGGSYGGEDVTAYATRFGEHLRSIVMDAPQGTPELKAFTVERYSSRATPREVRLDCLRSPNCAADHPSPDVEFAQLIQAIRHHPVQGNAYDASGNLLYVRIDESALLYLAANPTGQFISTGELLAAAGSLSRGDRRPLLRLGAEGVPPLVADGGDPTFFSAGALYATMCVDTQQPWEWSAPVPERMKQFTAAVSDLPSDYFAPFSKAAGISLLFSTVTHCLWWQKPTPSSPVTPPHSTYPNVPTLVLDGDMDTLVPIEEVRRVASLFPGSTFVTVAEAGHGTVFTECGANLVSQFIETLQAGDTTCAQSPETVWPGVGHFPLLATDARPAEVDPNGDNQISVAERRVVTVAVATATDAVQRSILGSGDGVGLRAGTFHTDYGIDAWTTTLTGCAFSKDVIVEGTVLWGVDKSFVADLTVSGSGTSGGALHVEGAWHASGPVGKFKISGTIGGHPVAVLVPEG